MDNSTDAHDRNDLVAQIVRTAHADALKGPTREELIAISWATTPSLMEMARGI